MLRPLHALVFSVFLVPGLAGCSDDGGGSAEAGTDTEQTSAGSTSDASTSASTTSASTTADTSTSMGVTTADPNSCEAVFAAIVTDIDETLTTSDGEFVMQIADGTYDPMARPGSVELVQAYADRGYLILYLTARSETIVLEGTGENAADATERWLEEHGFPLTDRTEIQLSASFVVGDTAATYKAEALAERQGRGWMFEYAYGNATSDISAYATAGIAKDVTFIIGEEGGVDGTVAVEGEGWVDHTASVVDPLPALCEP